MYMEVWKQILELCVISLLAVITTYLVKLIRRKTAELDEIDKSENKDDECKCLEQLYDSLDNYIDAKINSEKNSKEK